MSFHGCQQGRSYINDVYALHAGFLEHAEANGIIFVFPQVKPTKSINANGCWDWWGYINQANYATKQGAQMAAVANMLRDLGVDI